LAGLCHAPPWQRGTRWSSSHACHRSTGLPQISQGTGKVAAKARRSMAQWPVHNGGGFLATAAGDGQADAIDIEGDLHVVPGGDHGADHGGDRPPVARLWCL